MRRAIALTVLTLTLALPGAADASFPGANGKIAYVSGGDIWAVNADGSAPLNLTNSPGATESGPQWSPDGNKLLFIRGTNFDDRDVWVMNGDASGQTNLTNGAFISVSGAGWSPDQTKIAFGAQASDDDYTGMIRIMNADGTNVQPLPGAGSQFADIFKIAWSPDGEWILYSWHFGSTPVTYVVRPDGTDSRLIHGLDAYPGDWSPDSSQFVFAELDWGEDSPGMHLWLENPDGTNSHRVSPPNEYGAWPVWAPDGTKILYLREGPGQVSTGPLWTMTPDGNDLAQLGSLPGVSEPNWQPLPGPGPNADLLASITDSPDPVKGGADLTYTATIKNLVGPSAATGATLTINLPSQAVYVSATPTQGSCSHAAAVVTCNVGTIPVGGEASVTIAVEPPNVIAPINLSATATATATQPDPVTGNNSATAQTQVIFGGYARSRSATSMFVSLVPSYRACGPGEATLQHAAPFNHASCSSPAQTSGHLTVGTPDANAQPSNFVGSIKYKALNEPLPLNPNNGDQSDVGLEVSMVGVRKKSDLTLYTGGITVDSTLRITDHDSGAGGFSSNTGQPPNLAFAVPCSSGTCSLSSTYEAVVPGSVKEFQRAAWELGAVRVIDGGADGDPATSPNTVFATQGIFVP